MQVQFRCDIFNALGEVIYHKNEIVHRERSVIAQYLDRKECIEVKYRNAAEAQMAQAKAAAKPVEVLWNLRESYSLTPPANLIITKTCNGETTNYSTPPADAPQRIRDAFNYKAAQLLTANGDAAALEKAKREQYAADHNEAFSNLAVIARGGR